VTTVPETLSAGDILTIRQLAEYLMVSEKTVYRMIERNQLPAARVGAQWRFRRQDIDAWLTDEVRRVEYEGQRSVLDAFETAEIAIHPLLAPENVWLALQPLSRDEVLAFMIREATLDADLDREQLLRSVLDREALCSTALVEHAAFPHPLDPRSFRWNRKRVLLAVTREPLDYFDPHGHRPRVIAMILARSTQGHMLALSRAIKLFGDAGLVGKLATASGAENAIALIRDAESRLAAEARA
jgi:excisionase family DNA binding protein